MASLYQKVTVLRFSCPLSDTTNQSIPALPKPIPRRWIKNPLTARLSDSRELVRKMLDEHRQEDLDGTTIAITPSCHEDDLGEVSFLFAGEYPSKKSTVSPGYFQGIWGSESSS